MIGAMWCSQCEFEADVLQHDDFVVAVGLLEGALQQRHRVLIIAAEEFAIGAHHPVGRADEPLAGRIVAGPANQRAHRLLGFGAAGTRLVGGLAGTGGGHRQRWDEGGRHRSSLL